MQKINSATDLRAVILELERKQVEEGKILKEQFHLAYESIKPINLIKSTFKEAAASQELKDNILNITVAMTAGYLSKILFESVSNSSLKRLFGTALQFGITNVVAKNPEVVKSLEEKILNLIKNKASGRFCRQGELRK